MWYQPLCTLYSLDSVATILHEEWRHLNLETAEGLFAQFWVALDFHQYWTEWSKYSRKKVGTVGPISSLTTLCCQWVIKKYESRTTCAHDANHSLPNELEKRFINGSLSQTTVITNCSKWDLTTACGLSTHQLVYRLRYCSATPDCLADQSRVRLIELCKLIWYPLWVWSITGGRRYWVYTTGLTLMAHHDEAATPLSYIMDLYIIKIQGNLKLNIMNLIYFLYHCTPTNQSFGTPLAGSKTKSGLRPPLTQHFHDHLSARM